MILLNLIRSFLFLCGLVLLLTIQRAWMLEGVVLLCVSAIVLFLVLLVNDILEPIVVDYFNDEEVQD